LESHLKQVASSKLQLLCLNHFGLPLEFNNSTLHWFFFFLPILFFIFHYWVC
jgi:hypothetical protein